MDSIQRLVSVAEQNNGFISIKGYKSQSGQVADFIVQPLGDGGYHRLVRESIGKVEGGEVTRPADIEPEVWQQAIDSQLASWRKTLNGGHDRKNGFSSDAKAFYSHDDNDAVYIRHVVIVAKRVIEPGEFKTVKSRPLTIAKRLLVQQTPVARYQACFKLRKGCFAHVALKHHRAVAA